MGLGRIANFVSMEKLNLFFAQIKDISFWQRLFQWRKDQEPSALMPMRSTGRLPGSWRANRENIEKLKNRFTEISARNENLAQKVRDIELLSARKDAQA